MTKYFGTDGVRGVIPTSLSNEFIYKLTKYAINRFKKENRDIFLIAKDTRVSSDMIESLVSSAIMSQGADVLSIGFMPTPVVSYLISKLNFSGGVMISASHNSYEYNGIKFFDSNGYKLSDEVELEIEKAMDSDEDIKLTQDNIGRFKFDDSLVERYKLHLKNIMEGVSINSYVAVDCANGATSKIAKEIFDSLNIKADFICSNPNGYNINDKCGSTDINNLKEFMKDKHYDIGFSFDGDGDRVIAVDKELNEVDGDKILSLLSKYLKKKGNLKKDTLVLTSMSNLGVINELKENGIKVETTDVGDRYILENLIKNDYSIGGEQSGHIILKDYNNTGDGILSALVLLKALEELNIDLKDYNKEIKLYPQVLLNVRVDDDIKKKFDKFENINKRIEQIKEELKDEAKILIRPSGTEPLLRIMLQSKYKENLKYAYEIEKLFKDEL